MTDATTTLPPGPARDYLARLARLTEDLPPSARADLLGGVEEHLRDALDRGELASALARFGSPEEVAAAARYEAGAAPVAVAAPPDARAQWLVAAPSLVVSGGLAVVGAAVAVASGAEPLGPLTPHPVEVVLLVVVGFLAGAVAAVVSLLGRALDPPDRWVLVTAWVVPLAALPVGAAVAAAAPPAARWVVGLAVLVLGAWVCGRAAARVRGALRRGRGRVGTGS